MVKKSRLLSLVLSFALVLGCSATAAFAAESPTPTGSVPSVVQQTGDGITDQFVTKPLEEGSDYAELKENHPEVLNVIEAYNANHDAAAFLEALAKLNDADAKIAQTIKDQYKFATDFFDTDRTGENVAKKDGKFQVLYALSSLPTGSKAKLLHYNMGTKAFELLDMTETAQGWEVLFDELSPTAFMLLVEKSDVVKPGSDDNNGAAAGNGDSGNGAKAANNANKNSGNAAKATGTKSKSPKTGDASDWMLWMGAAVVLAGTSALALRRKEN